MSNKGEGMYISPNLEGNPTGDEARELRKKYLEGAEDARSDAEAHYRANEEAYRNQAIMDASKAGVDINTGQIKTTATGNSRSTEIRGAVISGSVVGNVVRSHPGSGFSDRRPYSTESEQVSTQEPGSESQEHPETTARNSQDLEPNLTGNQIDGATSQADVAARNYAEHQVAARKSDEARLALDQTERIMQSYDQAMSGIATLSELAPAGSEAKKALEEAQRMILGAVWSSGVIPSLDARPADIQNAYDTSLQQANQHLQQNREAYENEAANDYSRAREVDPQRYPDPLKYGDAQPPQGSPE